MARRFAVDIDLLGFSLLNAMINPVSSDPAGLGVGDSGRIWWNTTSGRLKVWNGTTAIDLLDRANQVNTQTASTISDFDTAVRQNRLDQLTAPTGPLSINSQKLTSVANGTTSGDAVNKGQLDVVQALAASAASGVAFKAAVRAVAASNITLSGTQTVDGVALIANDRCLVAGQSAAANNGIYVVASGAWTRATDADNTGELAPGTQVAVTEGASPASSGGNADSIWRLVSDSAITIGTDAQTWERLPGQSSTSYTAGAGLTLTGTTFAVGAGPGVLANADDVAIDTSLVMRKKVGVIPSSSSGMFSISGATVTINHGLNTLVPRLTLRAYTSPASGYTAGQGPVEVSEVASDADNLVIILPAAPSANEWIVMVEG
jgi:hypothetical protein